MNRHIPSKNSISRGFQRSQLQITSISQILTIAEERPRNDILRQRIILRQSLFKTNNLQHHKLTILRRKHTSRVQMEPNQTARDPPQSTHHPSSPFSLTWQAPSNFDKSLPGKAIATTFIPAARPPFTPSGESSNTIQCSGGIPAIDAAFKKMSGAGFPFLTSSAVTIASKRSIISWRWAKSNRAYLVRSQLGSN